MQTAWAQSLVEGDANAGATLYQSQCMSCHGPGGNSTVAEQPIVAGQHSEYLVQQIGNFKNGNRENVAMAPFMTSLTDEDANNIALYLQSQNSGLSGATDEALARKGESIYRNGLPEKGVPNCTGCHGPTGAGIPPFYPKLSGQHAIYTASTLKQMRSGERVAPNMADIASLLSDEDVEALAQYVSGLY